MVLTPEERKERKRIAQAKWRAKNREYARKKSKEHHEANKAARNKRKRELYAEKKLNEKKNNKEVNINT